jgi:DNA-binding transcriptional LysR family regulator
VEETLVFVVRPGHPLASGEVTPDRALSYTHVVTDYTGNVENLVDGFLPDRGVMRRVRIERAVLRAGGGRAGPGRVAVKVPNFCNVQAIIPRTDMVASMPRRIAAELSSSTQWVVVESPFDSESVAVEAVWHTRTEGDPGLTWLRRQIELVAAELN